MRWSRPCGDGRCHRTLWFLRRGWRLHRCWGVSPRGNSGGRFSVTGSASRRCCHCCNWRSRGHLRYGVVDLLRNGRHRLADAGRFIESSLAVSLRRLLDHDDRVRIRCGDRRDRARLYERNHVRRRRRDLRGSRLRDRGDRGLPRFVDMRRRDSLDVHERRVTDLEARKFGNATERGIGLTLLAHNSGALRCKTVATANVRQLT